MLCRHVKINVNIKSTILMIGVSFKDHVKNLCAVFEQLQEFGLRLKFSKCYLAKRQVTYLGYNVSVNGTSADPNKVEAVRDFPPPRLWDPFRFLLPVCSWFFKDCRATFFPDKERYPILVEWKVQWCISEVEVVID